MRGKGVPHKLSMAMRYILEERGIDLIAMQMEVYKKAIDAYDSQRGLTEKGDAGPSYLAAANQAIGTLAKYAYPTMTAIKLEDLDDQVNTKVVDAVAIRQRILGDPFSKSAVANVGKETIGIQVLPKPEVKKDE